LQAVDFGDIGRCRRFGFRSGKVRLPGRVGRSLKVLPSSPPGPGSAPKRLDWPLGTSTNGAVPPLRRSRSSSGALRCCVRFPTLTFPRVPARSPARPRPPQHRSHHCRRLGASARCPQRAAISAVGARCAEHVIEGKGHYPPFPKRACLARSADRARLWLSPIRIQRSTARQMTRM